MTELFPDAYPSTKALILFFGAAGGNNVETLHPVETSHAYSVFYFPRTKSFHTNGRPIAREEPPSG